MADWHRVASLEDVAPGTLKGVRAKKELIVLANVDGDVCALEDLCSHQDFPLSDGELDGDQVVCIHHGARFDACSGKNTALPAIRPVRTFPVEVRDGEIFVDLG
jgi:3-phenylpropionate/trans-cinnamate dioxygenase ferredoxin subunit